MADIPLESSLTAIDWLPKLNVGRVCSGEKSGLGGIVEVSEGGKGREGGKEEVQSSDSAKDGKPPYSYATLITYAIKSSSREKMTLNEIYQWITDNFPYYRDAEGGWKVSKHQSPDFFSCH